MMNKRNLNSAIMVVFCLFLLFSGSPRARATEAEKWITLDAALAGYLKMYVELLGERSPENASLIAGWRDNIGRDEYLINTKVINEKNLIYRISQDYPPATTVLFYWHDDSYLYSWLISGKGIIAKYRSEIKQKYLLAAIDKFRSSIGVQTPRAVVVRSASAIRGGRPHAEDSENAADGAAAEITKILFPSDISRHLSQVNNLIIVPILDIGIVPFSITRPFDSKNYLIDRISVSISPTIIDFWRENPAWSASFKNPLIVGDPVLPEKYRAQFPPLPGAREEAVVVAKKFGVQPLIGKKATIQSVIQKAPAADILYFATHGVSSALRPLDGSYLVLADLDNNDRLGAWIGYEIQSSKLSAKIAILSACQVGLGKTNPAGIIGLSRAFQLAGVPRVVMSLWSVNDKSTSLLMRTFMDSLIAGASPSDSLRQAMLATRKIYPNPAQWAAFVLFGLPR